MKLILIDKTKEHNKMKRSKIEKAFDCREINVKYKTREAHQRR